MHIIQDWSSDNELIFQTYLFNFFVAIVVLGKLFSKNICKTISKMLAHKKVDQAVVSFVSNIVSFIIFFGAIIAAISHLGFNASSLVAIVVGAALVIILVLAGSLLNFSSDVLLIILTHFKSDAFVEVKGFSSIVEEIHNSSTTFCTGDNKTVIPPKGSVTSSTMTNYSAKSRRTIALDQASIEIPYPQLSLYVKKEEYHES